MRTVPVKYSAGPLLDGCEPLLLISIFLIPSASKARLAPLGERPASMPPSFVASMTGEGRRQLNRSGLVDRSTHFFVQRPVICSSFSGYRAPCTLILEAALSISRRSSGVSSTAAAPMFSSKRCSLVVPGSEQSTAFEQAARRARSEQVSPSSADRFYQSNQSGPDSP